MADQPVEIELKLEGTAADLRKIEQSPPFAREGKRPSKSVRNSVYLDTKDRRLHRARVTLRLRRDGVQTIQTVKADQPGLLVSRHEWEQPIKPPGPDFEHAKATGVKQFRSHALRKQLRPVFETRVQRKASVVTTAEGGSVLIAVDRGIIVGGRRSLDVSEVELELKNPGQDYGGLFSLARRLGEVAPLWLSLRSKSDRGYALVGAAGPLPATSIDIPENATTEQAFRLIASSCLGQIVVNRHAVLAGSDAGVHRMRVGVRRFRAALSIFRQMLAADPETQRLGGELSWLADELGPARNLAVFSAKVIKPLAKMRSHRTALAALYGDVASRTMVAMERAADAASSERLRRLFLDLAQWIVEGQWSKSSARALSQLRDLPAIEFAAAELGRRHRKVVKRGRKLTELAPEQRHRLRIAAKKLRYGSEFFEELFAQRGSRKQIRRFARSLSRLQDTLGEVNDIYASRVFAESFPSAVHRLKPGKSRQIGYLAGLAQGRLEAGERDLLKSAERVFSAFKRLDEPWARAKV
jgi:inorganic triphosphatase YgiF